MKGWKTYYGRDIQARYRYIPSEKGKAVVRIRLRARTSVSVRVKVRQL